MLSSDQDLDDYRLLAFNTKKYHKSPNSFEFDKNKNYTNHK